MAKTKIDPPEPKTEVSACGSTIRFTLPIETVSESNVSHHWQKRAARHKVQKKYVELYFNIVKKYFRLPCKVTMKRFGKRLLDADDNLRVSLKWIKDAIAEQLTGDFVPGRADGASNIYWHYEQEQSPCYYVQITLDFNGA